MTTELSSEKLDKEIFNKILNDELTVKELKAYSKNISDRFYYIVNKIAEITSRKVGWFDYDNENQELEKRGFFNSQEYSKEVTYIGEFKDLAKNRYTEYDDYFPTNWFTEDFEVQLTNEVNKYFEEFKKEELNRKEIAEQRNKKLDIIKESIKAKLTPEELCFIEFASSKEINKKIGLLKKQNPTDAEKITETIKTKFKSK